MEENKLISFSIADCSKRTDRIDSSPYFERFLERRKWALYSDKYDKGVHYSELGVV
jgi:hypothetical protein